MGKRFSLSFLFIATGLLFSLNTACDKNDDNGDNGTEPLNEDKLVQLVNDLRTNGTICGSDSMPGVDPISWNDKLERAAAIHSQDMDENEFLSHTGSDGSTLQDRIEKVNYNWSTIGENVANGYPDEEAVISGWQESEGHCKNMMNEDFTEMGLAKSGNYWTMVLAAPR